MMNILKKQYCNKIGMTTEAAKNLCSHIPKNEEIVTLKNAAIVDATSSTPRYDCVIVIADGMITDIGMTTDTKIPANAKVFDAQGKFVIPGLWDMHVHQFNAEYLPLNIVNGVTGIRSMSGIPEHLEWRKQKCSGQIVAPRMLCASPIVDGKYPLRPGSISVHNAATARQAVHDSKTAGFDFIKVYNLISKEAFAALADESQNLGIPFAGHIPLSCSILEASVLGIASVEHLEGIMVASSTIADELQTKIQNTEVKSLMDMQKIGQVIYQAAFTHDSGLVKQIAETLAENGTWQTPTLTVLQASSLMGCESFPLKKYLSYMEPQLRSIWEQALHYTADELQRMQAEQLFNLYLRIVETLYRNGVELLAGTDTFVPGYSLHDELSLFVRAGLSPHEALCTATNKPAEFMGVADTFGTIEKGKIADMVVLKSNPLDNISNTRDISAVLLGGKLYDEHNLSDLYTNTCGRISPPLDFLSIE